MRFSPPLIALARLAETLLIALAGGVAFTLLRFPAGLMSGAMLAVAIAGVIGRPVQVPHPVARACFVLIGILLGSVVTPEMLRGMANWPLSIAILVIAALCMIAATAAYLRLVHRWDRLSALMGASPGSLAQVMALSAEYGLDLRAIAIVQTTRVLMLTVGLPAGLALFGLARDPTVMVAPADVPANLIELVILGVVSTVAAAALAWLRFPGGLLFGAMAGSGLLHGTGWIHAVLPWWLSAAGIVMLGAVAGARFANTTPSTLLGYLGAALGSFAVAIAVASCFVLVVTSLLPFPIADVVVAFSPGAQDTMMVLALALHLDPVFVGAHHVARFLVVTFSIALLSRRLARRPRSGKRWLPPRKGTFED
jgi:membrane AbrB-like protein